MSDLNFYAERLSKARFILTTRTGEFNIRLPNTRDFEFAPLSKAQLQKFALQWLGDERKATDLIDQIEKSPFADTALRPLTLAHLCAIFERVGRIPPKPKTVYRKVVALLLEEWDEQRGIERLSKYANFELDRRMEFLAHLAFELTLSPGSGEFSTERLKQVYGRICGNFDLDRSQAKKVVAELESHHGLFLESGFQRYQFAHKSLQEFLAAEYIVRLPAILTDPKTILRLPNELAIATSISSNSSLYLSNFVFQVLVRAQLPREFYETFITRLVQEKPEFYSERYVVFALAVLYSKYIETGFVEKGGQLALFSFDEILQECERFLELVAKRNVPSLIFEYYKSDHQFSLLDGTKLVELKRVHRLQQVALPETLFLREQFLPSEVK